MTNKEFFKKLYEVEQKQSDHNEFYELAEKYGFLTPWSEEIYEYPMV